jgi:hypothetical protein
MEWEIKGICLVVLRKKLHVIFFLTPHKQAKSLSYLYYTFQRSL